MSEIVSNHSGWTRHKKMGLMLLGGVIIGIFAWVWWFLSQPVYGTIHVSAVSATPKDDLTSKKRLYQGKNMIFSYEGAYDEKSSQPLPNGPVLESVFLATDAIDGRKIAVSVANRGTNDLSSDPSYQIRVNERTVYSESSFRVGPYSGTMFEKTEAPFEKIAFFSTDGLIVSMALTSLFRAEGLGAELEALVSDFRTVSAQ